MKRAVLLVALLAASGCGGNRDRQLASTFEEARLAARRGELSEARTLAERGLARAQPESEWDWTFRYLRGEILLLQHQTAEVAPLVRADVPAGPGFDRIRARQKFLEALVQRNRDGRPPVNADLENDFPARQAAIERFHVLQHRKCSPDGIRRLDESRHDSIADSLDNRTTMPDGDISQSLEVLLD